MKRTKLLGLALLVVVAALALTGCMSGDEANSAAETTTTETMNHTMTDGATAAVSTTGPAADLRVTLDRLLGEHAYLAMIATQKGVAGDKDFKAIAAALDQNSVELGDAVGSVYGAGAKKKFLDGKFLWRDHIGFFVDYTTGVAKKDRAMQNKAVGNLKAYIEAFSAFLAKATGLPQGALRSGISEHVMQLKGQLDHYAAGKYASAYTTANAAYEHMVMTGDTLAGGIADQSPAKFAQATTTQSASDLRVTLDRLLGEHALLAMFATQKGFDGDKDFKAIAASLDRNSVALADAIGSVYGPAARKEFLNGKLKWRAHIGFFVDYTVGLAKNDKAMQNKAVGNLEGYIQSFSAFLAKATGLPPAAVRASITEHVNQLKGQIDAYAAGNYTQAYRLMRQAYAHMYMTGDTLAGAIVKQSPGEFRS